MEPSITPALVAVLGSIGVGLMSIGAAMFFKMFKSPKEESADLTQRIENVVLKVEKNADDHGRLATNVAVLSSQVGTLAENVKTLGTKVENMWLGRSERWGG